MKMLVKIYLLFAAVLNLILAYLADANNFSGVFLFNIGCAIFMFGMFLFFGMLDYLEGKEFWG